MPGGIFIIATIFSGLTFILYIVYRIFGNIRRPLGLLAVIALISIAICVDELGLLIYLVSIPCGIIAYIFVAVKIVRRI